MYDKAEVLKLFPTAFRPNQKEALEQTVDYFNSGYKCVIVEAPPGFGKSSFNTTMGNAATNAYYFTPQLTLIDQILSDPLTRSSVQVIKGRQNYFCAKDPNGELTVDVGYCEVHGDKCDERKFICPYYVAKQKAVQAHIALMSFNYAVLEGRRENSAFVKRQLLIDDEAHNLGEDLVKHVAFSLSIHTLSKEIYRMYVDQIREIKDVDSALTLVSDIRNECTTKIAELKKLPVFNKTAAKQFQKLKQFVTNTDIFRSSKSEHWIQQHETELWDGKNYPKLTFTPLTGRFFAASMIWKRAEQYLLTSATFPRSFTYEIGLDLTLKEDEIAFIKVPSTFPPKNRPIINRTCGTMTYKNKAATMPLAIKALERILDEEAENNICVHVHSYENSAIIREQVNSKYQSRLMWHTTLNKQEVIEKWKKSRGKILLAVALTEGQDFKDDICRAQVIFKVPFPNVSDKRVAIRVEQNKEWVWYFNQALIAVEQAYGRAVRSPTDWARCYIVDYSFVSLLSKCRKDVAPWIIEALPPEWKRLVQ
ncbi:MAG: helicase C-terminal domain-containing protein [Candidatus Bathyarchaeia archaeon]|jgi:Rad3-related DNA helicase